MTPEMELEVTSGPLAAELTTHIAAGNLALAANVLNRRDINSTKTVEAREAKTVLLLHGLWGGIVAAANNVDHPAYAAALAAHEIGNDPGGMFDFAGAKAKPMLDGLEASGLLTPVARSDIEALCAAVVSRAEQKFGRLINWEELT